VMTEGELIVAPISPPTAPEMRCHCRTLTAAS
jgi:hypothetical protein